MLIVSSASLLTALLCSDCLGHKGKGYLISQDKINLIFYLSNLQDKLVAECVGTSGEDGLQCSVDCHPVPHIGLDHLLGLVQGWQDDLHPKSASDIFGYSETCKFV